MKVTVTGKDYEVSDGLRTHLDEELEKLERYYDPVLDARVTVEKEDRQTKVNVVLHVQGNVLKAAHGADTIHAAVDGAIAKVKRQLKRQQEKRSDHRSRPEVES